MAVKITNLQFGRSVTDETDANLTFGRLKLVSHRVVALNGNDLDALWCFHEVRTRCGHFRLTATTRLLHHGISSHATTRCGCLKTITTRNFALWLFL